MAYIVKITDCAKAELDEIVEYISVNLDNVSAAESLLDDFYDKRCSLENNP